jgi:hypothetical protein
VVVGWWVSVGRTGPEGRKGDAHTRGGGGGPHLAAERSEPRQRLEHQVGALLVVEPPDEAQQRGLGVGVEPQLPLQRALAGGLACGRWGGWAADGREGGGEGRIDEGRPRGLAGWQWHAQPSGPAPARLSAEKCAAMWGSAAGSHSAVSMPLTMPRSAARRCASRDWMPCSWGVAVISAA